MINYLLLYPFIMPLIGIFLVEHGAYSYSSGEIGYINGSFWVFLIHSIIFFIFFFIFKKIKIGYFNDNYLYSQRLKQILNNKWINYFIIVLIFFLILLLFFGGYKTIIGEVQKGEFRSKTIGIAGLGFLAFLITKFWLPSIGAYISYLHIYSQKKLNDKLKLGVILFFISFSGFLWGFKTSAISVILPSLIVLYWKMPLKKFIKISLIFFIIIYLAALKFDKDQIESYNINPIMFIFYRITIIEGDAFWKIWDRYINSEFDVLCLEYFRYLLISLGNKFLHILGINLNDPYSILSYKLSSYFTYLVNNDILSSTSGEHNITVTIASEGLVFLGFPLFFVFTIFAAMITAINYKIIKNSYYYRKPITLSVSSSFFVFCTWSWLKGGDITSVFHISNFIGIISSIMILKILNRIKLL